MTEMPTLSTPRNSAPAAKLTRHGSYIDFALCKLDEKPMTEIGTGAPLYKPGTQTQRMQEVVTALAIRGDAVKIIDGAEMPIEPGEIVSLWISGKRRFMWKEAQGKAPLQVGDVVRCTYTGDERGNYATPIKVWSFQIRKPKPEESAQTMRCLAIHQGSAPTLSSAADDDPF